MSTRVLNRRYPCHRDRYAVLDAEVGELVKRCPRCKRQYVVHVAPDAFASERCGITVLKAEWEERA